MGAKIELIKYIHVKRKSYGTIVPTLLNGDPPMLKLWES